MRMRCAWWAVGLVIVAGGCAPMPKVALQATPADLEILAGEWKGEYESAALGRRGGIEFKLKAGTDEAYGDVLMVPQGRPSPYGRQQYYEAQPAPDLFSTELLTIRFIRASNGAITGALDRYWDPDRECYANTTFNGRIGIGIIEGTFRTRFECSSGEATGTWTAMKRRARPSAGS